MDPFSLTVGIVQLSKETYLVANFIYKTLNSAKHSEEERKDALAQIRRELLFFQSFGRYFADPSSLVAGDVDLNEVHSCPIIECKVQCSLTICIIALAGRDSGYSGAIEGRFCRLCPTRWPGRPRIHGLV